MQGDPGPAEIYDRTKPKTDCTALGCDRTGVIIRGLCPLHYRRLMRDGTVDTPVGRARMLDPSIDAKGYLTVYAPQHPLTLARNCRSSRMFVHRIVLYAKVGPGQHPCHHCGRTLTWGINLQVDHLDAVRLNNDPSNLVPTCQPCNTHRALQSPTAFREWTARRRLKFSREVAA